VSDARPEIAPPIRALLAGVVDYAGLFPPAGLGMPEAVRNFSRYHEGDRSWMLGRFVVPVSRFGELRKAIADVGGAGSWRLSALAGENFEADMRAIDEFNADPGAPQVDAVEVRASTTHRIAEIASQAKPGISIFVEVPVTPDPRELIRALAPARLRAKIRTGGITPDAFPDEREVAVFIRTCYAAGVSFKATAGLHHPLRAEYPLTYKPSSPRGVMHGFLNVFLVAALCLNGLGATEAIALMRVTSTQDLAIAKDGIAWRDYRVGTGEIEQARRRLALSFGSCSFTEPVEDLERLNLI
jgi:hypothetical protein